jgi:hypothetical protein
VSASVPERLYGLLPALYRVRDNAAGEPLRALLGVIEREFNLIETDIACLYDNWFIETCEEWVVPYIGDLLGVRPIRSVESAGVSTRAYVANTLAYRRRKGTAAVLEQLARDTTGWPARAVEFFTRLATAQHLNHVRHAPTATPNLRDAASAELAVTPFDPFAHTAEVRRIASQRGRYNIPNVGLFLWRLQSYRVGHGQANSPKADFASARRMSDGSGNYYGFHPTGRDAPLFNEAQTETTITHLAEEHNVPGKLRRLALHAELERLRNYDELARAGKQLELERLRKRDAARPLRFMIGPDPVLRVLVQSAVGAPLQEIPRENIYMCEIPDEVMSSSPPPLAVAVDPERGRLKFPAAPHQVFVSYNYGFPGDLGGGPYDRTQSVDDASGISQLDIDSKAGRKGFFDPSVSQIGVSHLQTGPGLVRTLREAVNEWNMQPPGKTGVIVVMDSVTEHDAAGSPSTPIEIQINAGSRLLIVSGQWPIEENLQESPSRGRRPGRFEPNRVRAHFVGDLVVRGTAAAASPNPGACFLNGLHVEGNITVPAGNLGLLHIAHSTVVPENGGISVVGGNDRLRLRLVRSISGPVMIRETVPIRAVEIIESIVDAASASPASALQAPTTEAQIDRSTLTGTVDVQSINASESIFTDRIMALRRQTGCLRFCYVPPDSIVPRRYRCQPDLKVAEAIDEARTKAAEKRVTLSGGEEQTIRNHVRAVLKPLFESRDYGDPEYAQLERRCPVEIRTGGENGGEMGAFSFLEQPQREANLRGALTEYLRFGLEAGVFFVT